MQHEPRSAAACLLLRRQMADDGERPRGSHHHPHPSSSALSGHQQHRHPDRLSISFLLNDDDHSPGSSPAGYADYHAFCHEQSAVPHQQQQRQRNKRKRQPGSRPSTPTPPGSSSVPERSKQPNSTSNKRRRAGEGSSTSSSTRRQRASTPEVGRRRRLKEMAEESRVRKQLESTHSVTDIHTWLYGERAAAGTRSASLSTTPSYQDPPVPDNRRASAPACSMLASDHGSSWASGHPDQNRSKRRFTFASMNNDIESEYNAPDPTLARLRILAYILEKNCQIPTAQQHPQQPHQPQDQQHPPHQEDTRASVLASDVGRRRPIVTEDDGRSSLGALLADLQHLNQHNPHTHLHHHPAYPYPAANRQHHDDDNNNNTKEEVLYGYESHIVHDMVDCLQTSTSSSEDEEDEEDSGRDEDEDVGGVTDDDLSQIRRAKRYPPSSVARLTEEFMKNPRPDPATQVRLSAELGLSLYQVKIWFQNKRARSGILPVPKKHTPAPRANSKVVFHHLFPLQH